MSQKIEINLYDFGDVLKNYVLPMTIPEWESYGVANRTFDDTPETSTVYCGSNVTTRSLLIRNVVIGVEQILGHIAGGPVRNSGEIYVVACFEHSISSGFSGYTFFSANPATRSTSDIGAAMEKACRSTITILSKTYPTEVFTFSSGSIENPDTKNQVKTKMMSYQHQNKRILTKYLLSHGINIGLNSGSMA